MRLAPESQRTRLIKTAIHYYRHEHDLMLSEADRTFHLNSNNSEALGTLGFFIASSGNWDHGIAMINKAKKLNPKYPEWYDHIIFHDHFLKGEYDLALEAARLSVMPGNFWSHIFYAVVYEKLGKMEAARSSAEKVLEIFPQYPDYARDLCDFWWHGHTEDCEIYFESLRNVGIKIRDDKTPTN